MSAKKRVMLIVMDGLGAAPKNDGNAVVLANPSNLSTIWSTNPRTYLLASGEAVGLPKNVKGNSEVGHQNLGSGQIVNQTLQRINKSIERGLFMKSSGLYNATNHANSRDGNIHILGLLSDGAVHSHINHFIATLKYFAYSNFRNELYFHIFTDGRDTNVHNAMTYISKLQEYIDRLGIGKIATICGRKYGMDRNRAWDRTKIAFDLITKGLGEKFSKPQEAIVNSYKNNLSDEFIKPSVINQVEVKPGDSILHLNFRADRALQLTNAFIEKDFKDFNREKIPDIFFASMVEYRKNYPSNIIIPKQYITMPVGRVISSNGFKQLRIAESEKFPHVTYFFNGGTTAIYNDEDRIEVPSPNVALYDEKPEMSAYEMTEILLSRIDSNIYDFILVNFANPDMVAHTGNLEAAIKAVQVVDKCVHALTRAFTSKGGAVIITADHGNIEELIDLDTKEMSTEHSINPVPAILVGTQIPAQVLPYGSLRDIAPTILQLMGIAQPMEMTGKSLIRNYRNF